MRVGSTGENGGTAANALRRAGRWVRRLALASTAIAVAASMVGCAATDDAGVGGVDSSGADSALMLSSPAFGDEEVIPQRFAREPAGGDDISIPYEWNGAPEGTRSFALLVLDTHPTARQWVHWMVVDLPAGADSLPEGASGAGMPEPARELRNSYGQPGYGGPQPPTGSGAHQYRATIYALDVERVEIEEDADVRDFFRAVEDHVLESTTYAGFFGG